MAAPKHPVVIQLRIYQTPPEMNPPDINTNPEIGQRSNADILQYMRCEASIVIFLGHRPGRNTIREAIRGEFNSRSFGIDDMLTDFNFDEDDWPILRWIQFEILWSNQTLGKGRIAPSHPTSDHEMNDLLELLKERGWKDQVIAYCFMADPSEEVVNDVSDLDLAAEESSDDDETSSKPPHEASATKSRKSVSTQKQGSKQVASTKSATKTAPKKSPKKQNAINQPPTTSNDELDNTSDKDPEFHDLDPKKNDVDGVGKVVENNKLGSKSRQGYTRAELNSKEASTRASNKQNGHSQDQEVEEEEEEEEEWYNAKSSFDTHKEKQNSRHSPAARSRGAVSSRKAGLAEKRGIQEMAREEEDSEVTDPKRTRLARETSSSKNGISRKGKELSGKKPSNTRT